MTSDVNKLQPVNLTKVEVVAPEEFSDEFWNRALAPILNSSDLTVGMLINRAQASADYCENTDCFNKVRFVVDTDDEYKGSIKTKLSTDHPIPVKAKFVVESHPMKSFTIGSENQPLGKILKATYINRSVYQSGRYLQLGLTSHRLVDSPFQTAEAIFRRPSDEDPSTKVWFYGSIENANVPAFQSAQQLSTTTQGGLQRQFVDGRTGIQGLVSGGYGLTKRSVLEVADSADDEIKTYAGDSYKQSFLLKALASQMEYLPSSQGKLPTNGFKASVSNEIAAFSAKNADEFNKFEVTSQFTKTVTKYNVTFDCHLGLGTLTNLLADSQTVHFQDKFYPPLPGYTTLGLGKNDPLIGGLSYLSYKFAAYARFFHVDPTLPLRAYASVSGAKIANSLGGLASKDSFRNTASLGLLYKVGESAHCDIGYNLPLNDKNPDTVRPGLAVSLALYGDY